MKLLHLLSQLPHSTGSGYYVQSIINEALKAGHDKYLISAATGNTEPDTGVVPRDKCSFVRFESASLPFHLPGMSDVMPYKSKRFIDLTHGEADIYENCFANKINDANALVNPDIIHSNHLWLMTAVARQQCPDTPLVASCHGTDLRQLKNCHALRSRILGPCSQVDAALALSRQQKQDIHQLYNIPEDRIHVTGIGFNDKLFTNAPKPDPNPVNILYAGKLSRSKGVIWLLETLKQLKDLPYHLYLAGSGTGPEKEACVALAKEQHKNVTLCGALPQKDLAEMMKRSHIFILPSFFEGLPLVLFEALASGCKVITTDLDGAKELTENTPPGLIRLIDLPPLETIDAPFQSDMPLLVKTLAHCLAEEINTVITRSALPDAGTLRAFTQKHTWNAVFRRIETVYRTLLS